MGIGLTMPPATGAGGPLGTAARDAYSTGLDLGMAVGACCLAAAAVGVWLTFGSHRTPGTSGALRDRTAGDGQAPGAIPQEAGGRERSCA